MRSLLSLILFECAACAAPAAPDVSSPTPTPVQLPIDAPKGLAEAVGRPVSIEGRDVVLRVEGAEINIPYLSGELIPARGGQVVDLQSPRSFEVQINALEVRIHDQTLQHAIGDGPPGRAPYRDVVVRTEGDSVLLKGHTGFLNLPFSFKANPAVTRRGGLGLELEKVRLLGIGVKGFLGAFEDPIEGAVNKHHHFIEVDEDWLVINPFPFTGPPEVHAAFTSVVVRDHDIVARLGELTPREESKEPSGFILKGGVFRSQKTVYFDVTLRLVAQDGGALVIDPNTLTEQISGGVIKTDKEGDVTVYVVAPDQKPVKAIVRPTGGPEENKTPAEPAKAGEAPASEGQLHE